MLLCRCFLNIYTWGKCAARAYAQAESHSKRPGDGTLPTVRQSSSPRRICIDHLRMTKSASEEPGGVLRDRIWSNCVQPDDLRNPRQLSWCEMNRDFGAVQKRNRNIPDVKTPLYVWNNMWRKCLCREEYIHYPPTHRHALHSYVLSSISYVIMQHT